MPQLLGRSFQKARNFTASIVLCSDIHVLGSPQISTVVTRMQDLAAEFSQMFRGDTPGPSQREGATPSRTQHIARLLASRGAQAPQCWDPNLGPPQLFCRGFAPGALHSISRLLFKGSTLLHTHFSNITIFVSFTNVQTSTVAVTLVQWVMSCRVQYSSSSSSSTQLMCWSILDCSNASLCTSLSLSIT